VGSFLTVCCNACLVYFVRTAALPPMAPQTSLPALQPAAEDSARRSKYRVAALPRINTLHADTLLRGESQPTARPGHTWDHNPEDGESSRVPMKRVGNGGLRPLCLSPSNPRNRPWALMGGFHGCCGEEGKRGCVSASLLFKFQACSRRPG
jgi:hypothetical protein